MACPTIDGEVTTTAYLGQYSWERANAIAERLEAAGIGWWHKQAGGFTRLFFAGEWGVRLFVDGDRLEEAQRIAASFGEDAGAGQP
jgi:hypothetical protein